jgi:hypothetical protein
MKVMGVFASFDWRNFRIELCCSKVRVQKNKRALALVVG